MAELFNETPWPSADDAAQAILAAAMSDFDIAETLSDKLTPEDFANATSLELYADVFRAIVALVRDGKTPAPVLVAERMRRMGATKRYGDGEYDLGEVLGRFVYSFTPGMSIESCCEILRRYNLRRRIRDAGHRLITLANDDSLDDSEYVAQAETILTEAVTDVRSGREPVKLGTVIGERFDFHYARKRGEIAGLRTGFADLDDHLLGLQPTDLIIVAARPSMGKTAFVQQVLANVAKTGKTVLLVSREMSVQQLADRAIAAEGGVNGGLLRAGVVDKQQLDLALMKMADDHGLIGTNYFVDEHSASVPEIRRTATRLKRRMGLDLIAVDYLQLLEPSSDRRRRTSRDEDVGEIARGLKQLAKDLNIPVIALAQLSREVERREDKRPVLSDLRESGVIEQAADVVIFIYRDDYYKPGQYENVTVKPAEFIIAKFRNGPTGTVRLGFIKDVTKFVNPERRN